MHFYPYSDEVDRNASNQRAILARELHNILVESRLSQAGLGRASGVSRETIKLIVGEQQLPKPLTLRMLADGAASDGFGNRDPDKAAGYYNRLMIAAGYASAPVASPEPERSRPVEDLTDDEVRDALTRISHDPNASAEFLAVAGDWQDLAPSAQRFILNSFELARQMDRDIKAAEQRDAARTRRPRS